LNLIQRKTFCFDAVCAKTAIHLPVNTNWHVMFCRILFNTHAETSCCLVQSWLKAVNCNSNKDILQ
jgi:hypothetical protein